MTTTTYDATRDAYYEAQRAFRQYAVAEIERLLPENVKAVILEISDDPDYPRLRVAHYIGIDGEQIWDYEVPEHDDIDTIAADLEAGYWEEADSFLFRVPGHGEGFIIERTTITEGVSA